MADSLWFKARRINQPHKDARETDIYSQSIERVAKQKTLAIVLVLSGGGG
jgi:hypothetical protein